MSTNERIKRPSLDRTAPIRNWSTLLNAAPSGDAAPAGAADAHGTAPSGLGDAISRSVALGYQVVEEYVRQGERAARRMSEGSYRTEAATADAQDLVQRMGRYASELVGTWLELVQRTGATTAAAPAAPRQGEAAAPRHGESAAPRTAPTPARAARLAVALHSSRPAEVMVELAPEAGGARLVVHALRACEASKPRLDVEVETRAALDGAPVLSVRIPDEHPPGTYEGLIVDEVTNRPVGAVRVILAGAETRPI